LIYPYTKNAQIYVCPSDPGIKARNYPYTTDNAVGTKLSYLMNAAGVNSDAACGLNGGRSSDKGFGGASLSQPSVKDSEVQNPATKFFITEGTNYPTNPSYTTGHIYNVCASATQTYMDLLGESINTQFGGTGTISMLGADHFDGYNVLYVDGHVKWTKFGNSTINNWIINIP
jgi:prepilin-type processing-associated H-X9-DG protein